MKYLLALIFYCFLTNLSYGQGIAGYIYDSNNQPIPSARVQVKFNEDLNTVSDMNGKYFIRTEPGVYELVISSIGFESQTVKVTLANTNVAQNVWLQPSDKELDGMVVKSKNRDPAYEIIKEAIKRKKINKRSLEAYSCEAYIKASEELEKKVSPKSNDPEDNDRSAKIESNFETNLDTGAVKNNFAEIKLTLDFQYPNKTKETRHAVKIYGNQYALFYTTTTDARFSIYDNLINLKKVTETPIISPLSQSAIASYKFKLDSVGFYNDVLLYKIKVTPRKKGNATASGYIYIQDSSFAVTHYDLTLKGGNLYKYDEFHFTQSYDFADSLWLLSEQTFHYSVKNRKEKKAGYTVAQFSNYNLTPNFPKRYFNNELGSTSEEAYEKDSSYWESIRPAPLSIEEQLFIRKRDSLFAIQNSEVYLDSIDSVFNKVTLLKIAYDGIDHRNRDKKLQWGLGSIWDMVEPFEIAGVRVGPNYYVFKRWENQKTFWSAGNVDMGVRNGDIKGGGSIRYTYNPFKLGSISAGGSHNFRLINRYDAYLNYVRRSNYIEDSHYHLGHRTEIFNGLYSNININLHDRRPIGKYKFGDWIDRILEDNEPIVFNRYQSLQTIFQLDYVIGQQYLREPHRKVVLGSKGPTVYAYYEKGWNGLLGSDIDYDYIGFGVRQTFSLGTMGTSKYFAKTGRFLNTRDLRYVDQKFFRQSDRWLFSNALYSFQLLQENYPTEEWYFEGHYIHHFNGALINFIPLVKKLKIQLLAGGGALYLPEYDDFNYQELYFGVERVNKILRRRVRIGLYYIMARYSDVPFDHTFKFSVDILNERRNTWNF